MSLFDELSKRDKEQKLRKARRKGGGADLTAASEGDRERLRRSSGQSKSEFAAKLAERRKLKKEGKKRSKSIFGN